MAANHLLNIININTRGIHNLRSYTASSVFVSLAVFIWHLILCLSKFRNRDVNVLLMSCLQRCRFVLTMDHHCLEWYSVAIRHQAIYWPSVAVIFYSTSPGHNPLTTERAYILTTTSTSHVRNSIFTISPYGSIRVYRDIPLTYWLSVSSFSQYPCMISAVPLLSPVCPHIFICM